MVSVVFDREQWQREGRTDTHGGTCTTYVVELGGLTL